MYVDPNSWDIVPSPEYEGVELGYFTGNYFTAKAAGKGLIWPVFTGLSSDVFCSLTVYAGQLQGIRIQNDAGEAVSDGKFYMIRGSQHNFDAIGYDEYGNGIPVYPNWAASSSIGKVEGLGPDAGTLSTSTATFTDWIS